MTNHEFDKTRIEFNKQVRELYDFSCSSRVVSPANRINLQILDIRGRSLIYRRNKKGPRTDPRSTPRDRPAKDD